MLAIAIVSNRVSSACGIRYNSLVVGHGRDGQNIALCILDPIQFAVCIEVILRLSGICDGVFIAGLCHGAVCIQALKSAVSIILECGVRSIWKNYLIVTLCRNYDLTHIDIEIPANTKAAFLITHGIVSADKIGSDTRRSYAQICKRFCVIASCNMDTIANLPALTVEGVIRNIIRAEPWSEPVVFFCEIIQEINTLAITFFIHIAKIKRALCIQRTIFIVNVGFTVVPKNSLFAACITKINCLCTRRIDRLIAGSFVYFPCWSEEPDISGCPFAFHVSQCDVCPVSTDHQGIIAIGQLNCIIAVCLTKIKAVANGNHTAVQIHQLTGITTPAIRRCGTKYQIILNQKCSSVNIQCCAVSRPELRNIGCEGHTICNIKSAAVQVKIGIMKIETVGEHTV